MDDDINFAHLKVVDDPNLEKLPRSLPNTRKIKFYDLNNSVDNNDPKITPFHLHSFKDLPEKLPKLTKFEINNSNIHNFETLTAEMPNLKEINIDSCKIHNFIGFPKNKNLRISINRTTINSFEGLDLPVPQNIYKDVETIIKEKHIHLYHSTIRSLGGISRSTIQAILIAALSVDYDEPGQVNHLKLPFTALKLIQNFINHEIERTYSPKHHKNWPSTWNGTRYTISNLYTNEWRLFNSQYYTPQQEMQVLANKNDWIYGFNLMESLFYPEKLDILYENYRKTTRQLAQEYLSDPNSLPAPQIERLVHEIDPEIRKLLENNLPSTDPVITQISAKYSFYTINGFNFLK